MKVAIIGGGGTRTPILVKGLLEIEKDLGLEEIALYDIDPERLSLISLVLEELLEEVRPADSRVGFRYAQNLKEALKGSSFVFLTMRVGKEEMRILDERIPLSLGLIGQETVGAGGAAMAVRTVPKVLEIARLIEEECPSSWVINFTNPSGMVTEALLNHSPLERVVGICDGPSSIKVVLSRFLEVPEEEIFLDYFGLNHLGWVKGIFVRGEDYLPKVMKYLPMFPAIEKLVQFPVEFLLKLRMIPNPYLRYYYFPEKVLEEIQREPKTRGEKVKEMNEALFAALKEGKRRPLEIYNDYIGRRESHGGFLGRRESNGENTGRGESQYGEVKENFNLEEGEGYIKVALELLRGLSGFKVGTPVVNLRNRSAILGMEEGDVVEVPVHLLKGFIRPVASGNVPQECLELMRKVKLYEKKLIQGIVEGSREAVIEALSLNPLVGSLDLARRLVEEFSVKQCWGLSSDL
jgi:6-phospho-beta-glucosidase